jgi:hypothetical protein
MRLRCLRSTARCARVPVANGGPVPPVLSAVRPDERGARGRGCRGRWRSQWLGSGRWDALADSSASMLGLRNELCALRGLLGAIGDERRLWDGVEALASSSGARAVHNPTLWAPQLFEACVFVCLLAAASLAPPAALIAPACIRTVRACGCTKQPNTRAHTRSRRGHAGVSPYSQPHGAAAQATYLWVGGEAQRVPCSKGDVFQSRCSSMDCTRCRPRPSGMPYVCVTQDQPDSFVCKCACVCDCVWSCVDARVRARACARLRARARARARLHVRVRGWRARL